MSFVDLVFRLDSRLLFYTLIRKKINNNHIKRENIVMRMFKVTACVPSQSRIRTQRELQNTYFTKLVPYDNWFREQQRIMKMGGKIVKVELATGRPGTNTGLL
jgi:phycobilisome core linker protein